MVNTNNIQYRVECLTEDQPVEGNALCSGDAELDRKQELEILADLEHNPWAWCCVKVTASHPDFPEIEGVDYLGCCSYESEDDFRAGAYYDDMKEAAQNALLDRLGRMLQNLLAAQSESCETEELES